MLIFSVLYLVREIKLMNKFIYDYVLDDKLDFSKSINEYLWGFCVF